jgi:aminomethyltransferase
MSELLKATPLHARYAELNRLNRWENRSGFTLSTALADPRAEALAVRFGAAMADLSWHWRVTIAGERAAAFVSRLLTQDALKLEPGQAQRALWLGDGGAVRGIATLARLGKSYLLISEREDAAWIAAAAGLYGVEVTPREDGVIALTGSYAGKVLAASGLDPELPPLGLRRVFWRGLDVMLSRFGEGYELSSPADEAQIAWDRLAAAGKPYALMPVGIAAADLFALESGVVRAGRDFEPARDGFAEAPLPQTLALDGLVDPSHDFNGRAAFRKGGAGRTLAGVLFDADTPMPQTVLTGKSGAAGRTLGSAFSPALGRAVALAVLTPEAAAPGTLLSAGTATCRVTALPFLPIPFPIPDGKSAP